MRVGFPVLIKKQNKSKPLRNTGKHSVYSVSEESLFCELFVYFLSHFMMKFYLFGV